MSNKPKPATPAPQPKPERPSLTDRVKERAFFVSVGIADVKRSLGRNANR
ncbi:hypothetical protein [Streptomyces sp. NPDC047070]